MTLHQRPGTTTASLLPTPALLAAADSAHDINPSAQNLIRALADRLCGKEPEDYWEEG